MADYSLSNRTSFRDVAWGDVPASPGVYVIYENDEVIYVGMSGRNGQGNLRDRLRSRIRGMPRPPAIGTSSIGARFATQWHGTGSRPENVRVN